MGAPRPGRVLVAEGELTARVAELGRAIARDYAGENPVLVGVLQGAVPFVADLMRALPIDVTVDFIRASSYGAGTSSSGRLRLAPPPGGSVAASATPDPVATLRARPSLGL